MPSFDEIIDEGKNCMYSGALLLLSYLTSDKFLLIDLALSPDNTCACATLPNNSAVKRVNKRNMCKDLYKLATENKMNQVNGYLLGI